MKHTTINSTKLTVTAINGEVIRYGHEDINITTKHTCPDCGAIWYTYFEVYSFYDDPDAGTEPYEEWAYVSARCTACQPAARQNTYFFADKPKYACTNDGLALVNPITGKIVQKIGCNWICDEHCPLC